ncbi:MAG: AI-2E family transporter [Bdellovibrionota bacterium]
MAGVKSKEFFMTKLLISFASLIIVIAGIKAASSVLIPITFSIFLGLLGIALLKGFAKIKVPKFLAITIVMFVLILSVILFIELLKNSIVDFNDALPMYREKYDVASQAILNYLSQKGVNVPQGKIAELFTFDKSMNFLVGSLKSVVGAVSNVVLVLVLVLFILFEAASFSDKLKYAFKDSAKLGHFSRTSDEIQKYILIKSVTSFLTGLFVYISVALCGIDFPVLWGIIAFLFNFIPIIGSIVAAIPAILLALIQFGFVDAVIVSFIYIVINWTISYFIEPLMMGKNLGLSPLIIILSVFFWGWVWGSSGMLLSIPLMMVIKILFENSKDFYWVGVLMGDTASVKELCKEKEKEKDREKDKEKK